MDRALFVRYDRAVRDAFARGLGCTSQAFATERLTIVERPDPPAWPYTVAPPEGFTLKLVDAAWMAEEMPNRRFENGVGEPGVGAREFRNQFAAVLFDAEGAPVAVAGAFLTYGLFEIGVDIIRGQRGGGLAPLVVRAATAEIVARGEVPFYACAATNIRSYRTALASGFLPVCADTAVTVTTRE